jgi:hypothetical protein
MDLTEIPTFINKCKQLYPEIAGARVCCVSNKNSFNPATIWLTNYTGIEEHVKQFISNYGREAKSVNIEIITNYAAKELHLFVTEII